MGLSLFLQTCQRIIVNPDVNSVSGLMRHAIWHGVRRFLPLPAEVKLTERSRLYIEKRGEMNGCVALVWSQRRYDYHNMSFIAHLGAAGLVSTCFDIGANIGIYSLIMSECSNVTVHAFEPHPAAFATLNRMIEKNNRTNVSIWRLALSDVAGELCFTDDDFSTVNRAVSKDAVAGKVIQVPCETGAAFCERHQLSPDLLKIDTEGLEPEVLRGFNTRLQTVKFVFAEMNTTPEVMSSLLLPTQFAGPFFVDMPARCLRRKRHAYEDAVYINLSQLEPLRAAGFQLES